MSRTFLVDLDVGSDTDFLALSDDIQEALEVKGLVPISVKPWAGKTLGALPSLIPPGTQQGVPPQGGS